MVERMDVLGHRPERHAAFSGRILDREPDEELQALVRRAARELEAPTALVTLVLEHTQLFRAQMGLPPDLARVGGTDRDLSFCQFVVRDEEPLEVCSAPEDARVPQFLVEAYGVRSYLGFPLRVNGQVLGSLCVLDVVPREFDAADRSRLQEIASDVERRLTALGAETPAARPELIGQALAPAFGEMRNLLASIFVNVSSARTVAAELAPLQAFSEMQAPGDTTRLAGALHSTRGALTDLTQCLSDIEPALFRLRRTLESLERVASPEKVPRDLREVIETAAELAHHQTKLAGGLLLRGAASEAHALRQPVEAARALAAVLSAVAEAVRRQPGPRMEARVEIRSGRVEVAVSAGVPFDADAVHESLAAMVGPGVTIAAEPDAVLLSFE